MTELSSLTIIFLRCVWEKENVSKQREQQADLCAPTAESRRIREMDLHVARATVVWQVDALDVGQSDEREEGGLEDVAVGDGSRCDEREIKGPGWNAGQAICNVGVDGCVVFAGDCGLSEEGVVGRRPQW